MCEQASQAFWMIVEPFNKNVEECKMFDFIIEMIADIAELFVDFWVNKVINRILNIDHQLQRTANKIQDDKNIICLPRQHGG